ncbi:MAG: DNA mismatch repair protein MutS, partial [Thermodesulfovibrionales bacterium]
QKLLTFKRITVLNQETAMFLDYTTKRNLELLHNLKDGSAEGSLLWTMDETLTPMGGRFMRNALSRPLLSPEEITARQDIVEALMENYSASEEIRELLADIQDMERLSSRIISRTASPRDLLSLKNSLKTLPHLKATIASFTQPWIREMAGRIHDLTGLRELLTAAIADSPPLNPRDGGVIRDGYNKDVDELREISLHGKEFIARLEAEERQKTGISSLKVGYNKVFGYYIEVTRANLSLVPQTYIRKQTLANCERFITQDLKEYEAKVLGAEDRLKIMEHELYLGIIAEIQGYTAPVLETSTLVAELDFLLALAVTAKRHGYVRPEVTGGDLIEIINGRHPVIERLISRGPSSVERFIPNNTLLDCSDNRLLIITGPNMAGKSTFMRQTALIVLMAQMGSFVPADSARIGITDRIFTRIGASDYITKGQSTFMVEMIETANIINNATPRSLILLDEVGRGTSTFDGISIAWSVAEQLVREVKARTLFATHYNELTDLAFGLEGVKNYNVLVKEWGDEVIFLRKIEKGTADKSYGIQVARLAGIPDPVIERAKTVLSRLEEKGAGALSRRAAQLDLFASGDPLVAELLNLDLDSLTPQKAMKKLAELKLKAEEQA